MPPMTDRVEEEFASIEDIRLTIMVDVITRYLADGIDLGHLTEWVRIWELHFEWPSEYSGGWLRILTSHHLFMFARGSWPESTLRDSLEFLVHEATDGEGRWRTPMVDEQWFALMRAGHMPPGVTYHHHTLESVRAMTPEQRAELGQKMKLDD